jgi:hypothetical protein
VSSVVSRSGRAEKIVNRTLARAVAIALPIACLSVNGGLEGQSSRPNLSGMWSDPPATLLDTFCIFWCSDAGLERLNALLDDPANDSRPIVALYVEAAGYQREQYIEPRLTPEGLASLNLDPADDPGFLNCEPWAFAREIFAPHQLEIAQHDDRVQMRYGEWTIQRSIPIGPIPPAVDALSAMGSSVARYEGDALVIVTSRIAANLAPWGQGFPTGTLLPFDGRHSGELRVVERYTRSDDGERLLLTATLEDPWALREPLVLKKVWGAAPDQEISPYESCEPPTEFKRGTNQP